jgi:NADPH-dependent 2,4-dienoyl-CoA reductase/sulfur reductase-like enzyme
MELANAARQKAEVTVIGQEKVPFEGILGAPVGQAIQRFHESNGVKFLLSASISHFEPSGALSLFLAPGKQADLDMISSESDSSKVGSVVLNDKTKIPADLVV